MNNYITRAVIDRLKADTGSGGLYQGSTPTLVSGIYYYAAPAGVARPYIVLNISQDEDHALTSSGGACVVSVRIVGDMSDGGDQMQVVWNRVFGDAMLQTGRVPSYGLDRHTLTLPTNPLSATCTALIFTGSGDVETPDPDTIAWVMTFKLVWNAAAVSP